MHNPYIVPWNRIHIPSGELIIADDLRYTFDVECDRSPEQDINMTEGRMRWTEEYAKLGVASANVGNSCPRVYMEKKTGNLIIGEIMLPDGLLDYNNPPEVPEGVVTVYLKGDGSLATEEEVQAGEYSWEVNLEDEIAVPATYTLLGTVDTHLWAYMLADKTHYIASGGHEELLDEYDYSVVNVKPGYYHFVTYCNHPEFRDSYSLTETWVVYAEAIFEEAPTQEQ